MIAHREVGAADGTLEQHVADDGELAGGVVEDDMARRVAGAMIDVEREVADRHLVAVLQPAVGFEAFAVDAISRAVLAQPVDPEAVGRSEEHTSELQSLMRISYAVFCLKKTN